MVAGISAVNIGKEQLHKRRCPSNHDILSRIKNNKCIPGSGYKSIYKILYIYIAFLTLISNGNIPKNNNDSSRTKR